VSWNTKEKGFEEWREKAGKKGRRRRRGVTYKCPRGGRSAGSGGSAPDLCT
jgi:hypothetical protein